MAKISTGVMSAKDDLWPQEEMEFTLPRVPLQQNYQQELELPELPPPVKPFPMNVLDHQTGYSSTSYAFQPQLVLFGLAKRRDDPKRPQRWTPEESWPQFNPTWEWYELDPVLKELDLVSLFDPTHDCAASVSSLAAPSIFSVETGVSKITASTQYSKTDIVSATYQLVELFSMDETLGPLIQEALHDQAIGAEKFSRNFRRLLKRYSQELKEEAGESLQFLAAKLVQWKAREVAYLIMDKALVAKNLQAKQESILEPIGELWLYQSQPPLEEEDSDDEEFQAFQCDSLETLAPVKDFLLKGSPFENLKTNFETFVRSPERIRKQTTATEIPEKDQHLTVKHILARARLTEPPSAPGKERVRWKCNCGARLYDDYTELSKGGIKELCGGLAQYELLEKRPEVYEQWNGTTGKQRSKIAQLWVGFKNMAGLGQHCGKDNDGTALPTHNAPEFTISTQQSTHQEERTDALKLQICTKMGSHGAKLHHRSVGDLEFDRDLFARLREAYREYRGAVLSRFSLTSVSGIHFTKFTLMIGDSVDVRDHETYCDISTCSCLPPKDMVESKPPQYKCHPIPPKVSPPVGPNLMVHLLNHPECVVDEQTWILKQIPKRLQGRLAGQLDEPVVGWGINFKEDWHWSRIWAIMLVVFVLGSLVFGVMWTVYEQDIQGAFGVASWWMSAGTIFLGYVATRNA